MFPLRTSFRTPIIVAAVLAACGAAVLAGCGAAAPSPSPSPAPTTEAASATPSPAPITPTVGPTATPAATATQTPVPGQLNKANAADLVELKTIEPAAGIVLGLSFSQADHHFATFGAGHSVDIWDADTGDRVHHLGGMAEFGLGLAYSPDSAKLISGASGGDITIWDAANGKKISSAQAAPPAFVYTVAWSPTGDRFAVAGEQSSHLTIYGSGGNVTQDIKTPQGWLWGLTWSQHYLAVSNDRAKKTYIYDGSTYSTVGEVDTDHPAHALDFSPDEKIMVTCLRADGMLHVWKTSDWSEVTSWEAHPPEGRAAGCWVGTFSKDGSVYFTGGDEGDVIAWDIQTGDRLKTFEYGVKVWSMSLSGDGKLLGVGLDNGQVKIIGLK